MAIQGALLYNFLFFGLAKKSEKNNVSIEKLKKKKIMAGVKEEKITSFDEIESKITSATINSEKDTIEIKYENTYKVYLRVLTMCCDIAEFVVLDDYPLNNLVDDEIVKITEEHNLLHMLDHIDENNGFDCYIAKHIYKIELKNGQDFFLGATDESNGYYDLEFTIEFP